MSVRCTLEGEGENGRTSWMMVCDDSEGDRRNEPFGDREREVGVSVCPAKVYTCSFFRKSNTYKLSAEGTLRKY